jgi:hypothetical protein
MSVASMLGLGVQDRERYVDVRDKVEIILGISRAELEKRDR